MSADISQIVADHLAQGRSYPRPTTICQNCSDELVLCWGPKTEPHWKHKIYSACFEATPIGEGAIHKLAKDKLMTYLNGGGTMSVICKCRQCKIDHLMTLPVARWRPEIRLECGDQLEILDLGGFDINGQLIAGLEIRHTHKVETFRLRSRIEWYEVGAIQVLNLLDRSDLPDEIRLQAYNGPSECEDFYCYPLIKLAAQLGYLRGTRWLSADVIGSRKSPKLDPIWRAFLQRQVCLRCSRECYKLKKGRPFCKTCRRLHDEGV